MITVNSPLTILFGGPIASKTVSPKRHAGKLLIMTVGLPSMTTPGPCGGTGKGVVHRWMSAMPAIEVIIEPMAAAAAALVASSAAFAAGAPGVPAAASVADSATLIVVSLICFAACSAAAAAAGTPRHAGKNPIRTVGLPGPGCNTGGRDA
ncbi:MAG: hypothetical protein R2724_10570 [Bryobacterales bacterium]